MPSRTTLLALLFLLLASQLGAGIAAQESERDAEEKESLIPESARELIRRLEEVLREERRAAEDDWHRFLESEAVERGVERFYALKDWCVRQWAGDRKKEAPRSEDSSRDSVVDFIRDFERRVPAFRESRRDPKLPPGFKTAEQFKKARSEFAEALRKSDVKLRRSGIQLPEAVTEPKTPAAETEKREPAPIVILIELAERPKPMLVKESPLKRWADRWSKELGRPVQFRLKSLEELPKESWREF